LKWGRSERKGEAGADFWEKSLFSGQSGVEGFPLGKEVCQLRSNNEEELSGGRESVCSAFKGFGGETRRKLCGGRAQLRGPTATLASEGNPVFR